MIEYSRLCLDPIQARCAFYASVPRLPDAHLSSPFVRGSCFKRVRLVYTTMLSDVNIDLLIIATLNKPSGTFNSYYHQPYWFDGLIID